MELDAHVGTQHHAQLIVGQDVERVVGQEARERNAERAIVGELVGAVAIEWRKSEPRLRRVDVDLDVLDDVALDVAVVVGEAAVLSVQHVDARVFVEQEQERQHQRHALAL